MRFSRYGPGTGDSQVPCNTGNSGNNGTAGQDVSKVMMIMMGRNMEIDSTIMYLSEYRSD